MEDREYELTAEQQLRMRAVDNAVSLHIALSDWVQLPPLMDTVRQFGDYIRGGE
jgi:hypothetical protein